MDIEDLIDHELYHHEGENSFSGAYTNAIYARHRADEHFSVWVKAWNDGGSVEDCWHKDIRSPCAFISACQDCLEFVDFGDADVVDVVRAGFDQLKKLNSEFAELLRDELLCEFSEDCAAPPAEPTDLVGGKVTVTRLSNEEARQKYGSSMIFITDSDREPPKDDARPAKGPRS